MGGCFSTNTGSRIGSSRPQNGPCTDEVNRLLDKWTLGHVSVCIVISCTTNVLGVSKKIQGV